MAKSNGKTTVASMFVRMTAVHAKGIILATTALGMSVMRLVAIIKRKTMVPTVMNMNVLTDGVLPLKHLSPTTVMHMMINNTRQ